MKLCALAPFVAPVAALLAWMFLLGQSDSSFALVPILLLVSGWLSGGIAVAAAKKIGSRWSIVASVGIGVSLLEIVLCCVLFYFFAIKGYMPGS